MTAVAHIQQAIATRRMGARHPFHAAAEALAGRLVPEGSIMTVHQQPPAHFLVGSFRWLEPRRVFWFTACGNSVLDAHVLEFDDTEVVEEFALAFLRDERLVGYLTGIECAGVDDPDDYRIAFQFWQEVAPLRTAFIEQCCATLANDALNRVP